MSSACRSCASLWQSHYGVPAKVEGAHLHSCCAVCCVLCAPQVAACAALTNLPYINQVRDALLSERTRLFDQLQQVSWLEPYPSQANFILCKVLEVRPQPACMQQCPVCPACFVIVHSYQFSIPGLLATCLFMTLRLACS